ncbi:MAG TPA: phosphotransferase family protein [Pseudonocardia sp.]|jgi:aminoglycoside phosphotransferase (APT) family kinase protein|nr:phosphotransferase family protein [Pseudonocardia sp.]
MALKNLLDPAVVAARLAVALERHLDGARDARVDNVSVPSSTGMSNETVLFDAAWTDEGGSRRERLVARVQPAGPAVFPRYDLGLEFAVMGALASATDVPVPAMYFHESDDALLGAPFLVMRRIDGTVPSDDPPHTVSGWVSELAPERQATLYDNALGALARIHAVDIDAVGLRGLRTHAEAELDGQLALWSTTFDWAAQGQSNPTVEAALDWVRAHRPVPTGASVLNWGDARIGNLLFDDRLDVAGVLDWEMVCFGPRELDLGWWLLMQRYYTEGIGAPPLPGFPDRDQLLDRYRQLSDSAAAQQGREPVELGDLHYYEVLAALRLSILMHRAGNLMIAAGQLPPGSSMGLSNPASHLLARLLDLPAPVGEAQSFAGNR